MEKNYFDQFDEPEIGAPEKDREPIPQPFELSDDPDISEAQMRKRFDDRDAEERARVQSSYGLFGSSWGLYDDEGSKNWATGEQTAAQDSIAFWTKTRDYLRTRRERMGEAAKGATTGTFTLLPGLPGIKVPTPEGASHGFQDWAERKADENIEHAQLRKSLADEMVAGERESAKVKPWLAMSRSLAKGVTQDVIANLLKGAGAGLSYAQNAIDGTSFEASENSEFYKLGQLIEAKTEEAFPDDPARAHEFKIKLARGAGSMVGFYGPGLAYQMIAKAGPKAMMAMTAGMGSGAQSGAMYEDASRAMAERPGEVTEEDRFKAWLAGIGTGATEALPLGHWLSGPGSGTFRKALAEAWEEGGQEFTQAFLENIAAAQLYDPDRKWDDNAWEGMAIGGLLGAKMSLMQSAWVKAKEQREARLRRGPGGQPSMNDVEPTPAGPDGAAGGGVPAADNDTGEPGAPPAMAAYAPRGPSKKKGVDDKDIADYLRANNDIIIDEQGREFDAVKRPEEAKKAVERQLGLLDRYADERDLKWYMDNGDVVLEDMEGNQYRPESGNVNTETFVETLGRDGPEALDSILAGQGFTAQPMSQTDKELFGDFDALLGQENRPSTRQAPGSTPNSQTPDAGGERVASESDQTLVAPEAEAQPTRKINDQVRAQFGELLAGPTARKGWAQALGVTPQEMAELEAEAIKDGRLRKAANGQIRRAPKAKAKAAAPKPAAAPSAAAVYDTSKLAPGSIAIVRAGKGKATDRWQIERAIKLPNGKPGYGAKRWIKKSKKWSGTTYQIAAADILSVEPEAVVGVGSPEDMAAREAAARAFMKTPEWIGASLTGGVVTNNVPGYMTDGWKARREYVDPKTSETILGYDAAVDLFVEQKKAEVVDGPLAERKAYIVIGLPGSGKGTVSTVLRDRARAVHVTCDDCKLMIPEYQGGFNSMGVHEESSEMSASVVDQLLVDGTNVILEKVGSSDHSIAKAARQFREEGYTVALVYADVPRAVAMERAIKRYRRTGRIVPLAYYDQLNIQDVYTILKKEGAVDETAKIDWVEPTGWRVAEASADDLRLDIPDRGAARSEPGRPGVGGSSGTGRVGSDVRAPQAAPAEPIPGSPESRVARHIREIEAATGRTIDASVADYATRLLAALPNRDQFDAVFEELVADKTMTVARARDLATLVGAESINNRSTKAKSLTSIKQRRIIYAHTQAKGASAAAASSIWGGGGSNAGDSGSVGEAARGVPARGAPEDAQGLGEDGLPEGAPGASGAGRGGAGGDAVVADDDGTGPADGLYRAGEAAGGDPLAGARDGAAGGDLLAAELTETVDETLAAEIEAREARTRRNYEITDADQIGQGGAKAKVRGNIAALRVLKEIEEAGREATEDEKKTLVKYVGWGAFAQDVFRTHKPEWARERAQLADLLSPEEMRSARESTLNAHYTSPEVIRGMWGAVYRLGYRGGRAIEPAVGVGHFIGMTPRGVRAETAWTAVDLDTLSARITKALYGAADVRAAGYETQTWPDGFFDLAISNVPFGDFKIHDKRYPSLSIHDYFFVKSLDKVRPGGLVAFVTSHYTLDKTSAVARREMAKRATFLGAIRLPGGNKGAFASNAGTEVTTDIIFLRRRVEGEPLGDQSWLETGEIDTPEGKTKINQYFVDHPEMMLGKMRLTGTMYGGREPVLIGPTDNLDNRILEAAELLPEDAMLARGTTSEEIAPEADTSGAAARVKEGAFYEEGGKLFRRVEGVGQPVRGKGTDLDKIRDFMGLRDIVNEMLARQAAGDTARMDALRAGLNEAYDAFVEKHGPINKTIVSKSKRKDGTTVTTRRRPNFSIVEDDPDSYKVAAIEVYNETTGTASKAAIFVDDIVGSYARPTITGPADALAVSLNEKGKIDIPFIAERLGMTEAQAIRDLGNRVYLDPNGDVWRTAEQYLAGDVVTKLEAARAAAETDAKYKRNVKALEAVQPEALTRVDITVPMGAPWVPSDVYEDFVHETMNARVEIGLNEATKKWQLLGGRSYFPPSADAQWATRDVKIERILEAALNQTYITVSHKADDGSSVRDVAAEQEANARVRALRDAFTGSPEVGIEGWVWQNEARAQRLEALYNQGFNRLVPEVHDGSHLTFPGLARVVSFPDGTTGTIDLQPHRTSAIWRIIQNGNTLLNHVVGAGKTWTMIMSGMEQKRLGLIQRPMYVVPNHMLEQFSTEFLQAYPGAKILVASKDHMSLARRREFAARVAAEKWDGIIITHDAFGRLRMSDSAYADFYSAQAAELEEIKQRQSKERGKEASVKEIEKAQKRLTAKIKKLQNVERKDAGVTFEEMGIDFLYVDEAHLFKNLSFPTQHARVKGISNSSESQRATDLFIKIQHLERARPGRSAVFATGTPVSNTMAELFTMQRYLQLDTLKEYGINEFDAWAHTFGQVVAQTELAPDGRTFRTTEAFSRFVNIPELVAIWSRVSDTKTADMLNLPRPKLKGGSINVVESEPSEAEEAYMGDLIARAERLRREKVDPAEDNMLKIVSEGRKVATDMRLIDPAAEPNPDGKIAKAVENIHRIWEEGSAAGADAPNRVQMVFLDMGVPGSKGSATVKKAPDDPVMDRVEEIRAQLAAEAGEATEDAVEADLEASELTAGLFNLYEDLRSQLVARGIPKEEIAFIHEAKGDDGKARLFAAVKAGRVRVLIGSTSKMGVGTNVQKRLIAMHHIDAPWKPAEVEQRDGRIVRQGNMNKEVEMYRYVTRRSFDAYMWQTLERKARFIGQLQSGAKGIRVAEDIDNPLPEAAQLKAAASGDMRIVEHAELTREISDLEVARRAHLRAAVQAGAQLTVAQDIVKRTGRVLADYTTDAARVTDLSGDNFAVTLTVTGREVTVKERKKAGEAIRAYLWNLGQGAWYGTARSYDLGTISGFAMSADVKRTDEGIEVLPKLAGAAEYASATPFILTEGSDPVGMMSRFERLVREAPHLKTAAEMALAKAEADIPRLETAAKGTPFPRQARLDEAKARLVAIEQQLSGKGPPPASPTGDAIKEFARDVAALKKATGTETVPRQGKAPKDTILSALNMALIEQVDAIQQGSRIAVLEQATGDFLDKATQTLATIEKMRAVDPAVATIPELETLADALNDLTQIIADRLQAGYDLIETMDEVSLTLQGRLDEIADVFFDINSEVGDMFADLSDLSEEIEALLPEVVEDDIDAEEEVATTEARDLVPEQFWPEHYSALDILADESSITQATMTQVRADFARLTGTKLDDLDEAGLRALQDQLGELAETLHRVRTAADWLADMGVTKRDEVDSVVDKIKEERITPRLDELETAAEEVSELIDTVDEALNGPTAESIIDTGPTLSALNAAFSGAETTGRGLMAALVVDGKTYQGATHGDAVASAMAEMGEDRLFALVDQGLFSDGFVTPDGRFLTRAEAADMMGPAVQISALNLDPAEIRNAAVSIDKLGPNDPHPSVPVLAYHGTRAAFSDRFDVNVAKSLGVHFGTREQADWFTGARMGGGGWPGQRALPESRIFPVIINVNKVLDVPDAGAWEPTTFAAELEGLYPQLKGLRAEVDAARATALDNGSLTWGQEHSMAGNRALRQGLTKRGIEALRYRNTVEGEGWSYIVWEKGKVTSALDRDAVMLAANALPDLWYRGDREPFTAFDPAQAGANTGAPNAVLGAFFTSSEGFARGYGVPRLFVPNVKNPYRIAAAPGLPPDPTQALNTEAGRVLDKDPDSVTRDDFLAWRQDLTTQGFDGILVEGEGIKTLIAFDPTQALFSKANDAYILDLVTEAFSNANAGSRQDGSTDEGADPDQRGQGTAEGLGQTTGVSGGSAGSSGAGARADLTPTLRAKALTALLGSKYSPEAIAARAKKQGFTRDAWHATMSDFTQPNAFPAGRDAGFHVAIGNPTAANARMKVPTNLFERMRDWVGAALGDSEARRERDFALSHPIKVMPLKIRVQNSLRMPDIADWANPYNWRDALLDMDDAPEGLATWVSDYIRDYGAAGSEVHFHHFSRALFAELESRGYDSVIYENRFEGASGQGVMAGRLSPWRGDSLLIWDTSRVRSAYDTFNDEAATASGLVASKPFVEQEIRDALNGLLRELDLTPVDLYKRVADPQLEVTGEPTAQFTRESPVLLEEVEAEFRRILPSNAAMTLTDQLGAQRRGFTNAAKRAIVVSSAQGAAVAREVGRHETVHLFRELGLWTDAEWATLVARAKKIKAGREIRLQDLEGNAYPGLQRYRSHYRNLNATQRGLTGATLEAETNEFMDQELVAHMAETYVSGQARYGKTIEALLDRLLEALAAIARVLNRHGIHVLTDLVEAQDTKAILDAAFSGQMADRPQVPRQPGNRPALVNELLRLMRERGQGVPFAVGEKGYIRPLASPELAALNVYHGSASKFERFDDKFLRTGEGHMAFGPGFYFAEAQDVAETYRTTGKRHAFRVTLDGARIDNNDYQDQLDAWRKAARDLTFVARDKELTEALEAAAKAFGPVFHKETKSRRFDGETKRQSRRYVRTTAIASAQPPVSTAPERWEFDAAYARAVARDPAAQKYLNELPKLKAAVAAVQEADQALVAHRATLPPYPLMTHVSPFENEWLQDAAENMANFPDLESWIASFGLLPRVREMDDFDREMAKGINEARKLAKAGRLVWGGQLDPSIDPKGYLYTVDLKVDSSKLLDLDKAFINQSAFVRRALKTPRGRKLTRTGLLQHLVNPAVMMRKGHDLLGAMRASHPVDANLLDELRALGLHGIRFLDGFSRSRRFGTHNYVVFDPKHIVVKTRNGEVVSAEERAAALQGANGTDAVLSALNMAPSPELSDAEVEAVMASPEWLRSASEERAVDTSQVAGFGTERWARNRRYQKDGRTIVGFDNVVGAFAQDQADLVPDGVVLGREAFVIMGYPGAGKSTIAAKLRAEKGAVHISADDAKLYMPEYQNGANSTGTQYEAVEIAIAASAAFIDRGGNVILETIGDTPAAVAERAKILKSRGYRVTLIGLDIDRTEAMRRAVTRFQETGRAVPRALYDTLSPGETYDKAKDAYTDHARLAHDGNGWRFADGSNGAVGLARALVGEGAGAASRGRSDAGRAAQGSGPQVGDRLARARAMGFDTSRVWYHGTNQTFERFEREKFGGRFPWARIGIFLSNVEAQSKRYADHAELADRNRRRRVESENSEKWPWQKRAPLPEVSPGRVLALYVRPGRQLVVDVGKMVDTDGTLDFQGLQRTMRDAKADGYDSVLMLNNPDSLIPFGPDGTYPDELVIFDPVNLRSTDARFEDEGSDLIMSALNMDPADAARQHEVRAAIEYNGRVFAGATHIDAMMAAAAAQAKFVTIDMVADGARDGFMVDGQFLTRDEAEDVVMSAMNMAPIDAKIENGLRRLASKLGASKPAARTGAPVPGPVPALMEIIADLKSNLGMTTTQGRYGLTVFDRTTGSENNRPPRSWSFRPQEAVRGQYDNLAGVARYRLSTDIETIAHEGGHHVDRLMGANLQRLKEQFRPELETFAFINMTDPAPDREPPQLPEPGADPLHPVYAGVDLDADTQRVLAEVASREEIRQSQRAAQGSAGVIEELSAFDRASREELEHRVGLRMADALVRDVLRGSTPETRATFVRARYSANGIPRPGGKTSQALHEGFAEFFREYVLNPERARSFSPGFYQAFEDLLDATDPALLMNLERAQIIATSKEYDAYLKATTLDRGLADLVSNADQSLTARAARTLEAVGQKGTISGFAAKVYTSAIDELHPMYLATKALLERADLRQVAAGNTEQVPVSLAVHENPYKLMRSIGDSFKTGLRWIQDGVPNYREHGGPRSPSLWDALTKVMGTKWDLDRYQKFGVYLESRRAIEEWKLWDKKLADTKTLTNRVGLAQRQARLLRDELARVRGKLDRRQRAMTANQALLDDYDRELRSLTTREANEVRDLQEGQVATPGMTPQRVRNAHARLADIRARIIAFEERRATVNERHATVAQEVTELGERVNILNQGIAKREDIGQQARRELARLKEKGMKRPPHRVRPEEHAERIKAIEAELPEVKDAAPLVYAFVWQMAVHDHQAGRLTDEELAYRETRKGFYVPFARDMRDLVPEGRGFGGRASGQRPGSARMGKRFAKDKMFGGSDRSIVNPLETIIDQTFHRAAATHFNDAMRALADVADFAGPGGGGEIAERVVKTEEIAANDAGWRTLEGDLIALGYDPDDAREMVRRVESDFGDTQLLLQWSPEHMGPGRPLLIPLWEKGERKFLRINDPEFANHIHNSINGMGRELSTLMLDWLSKPATWLRMGVTTNPTFIIPNVIRDMWSAWILTGSFMDPRSWPVVTQFRGIYHELRQTDMARLYQEVAGIMGGQNVAALSRVRDKMDILALNERGLHIKPLRLITASSLGAAAGFAVGGPAGGVFGAILGAGLHRAGKGGAHFTETLALFSDMSETATRLGVFTQAYKAALIYNPSLTSYQAAQEAAYVARDLIDFGRRGSKMLAAARLVPFLNANIQGLDKAARTLTARSDRGRVIGGAQLAGAAAFGAAAGGALGGPVGASVGATAVPAVATMLAARSDAVRRLMSPWHKRVQGLRLSADEQRALGESAKAWANLVCYSLILLAFRAIYWDDEEYQMIEPRVKYRGQPVKLGDEWFAVPKAFEWAIPSNLIEAAIDAQYFNDPRFLARVQESLYDNLTPPLIPQTAKLWRDIGANKNSLTNRPIVPDWMRTLPPQEQFNAYSSELAIGLSRAVNESPMLKSAVETAGSAVFATDFELSPLVIDYAISTGFGYWGKDIQKLSNVGRDAGPSSGRPVDFPILGTILQRISVDPYKANEGVAAFYEQMSPFTQGFPRAAAGYDTILKNRGQVEANQFLATLDEDHRAYALLMGSSATTERRLHPLNRLEDVLGAVKSVERDVIMERLDNTEVPSDPERIALAPQKAAEIRDILAQIKGIEANNTMVFMGYQQFAGRAMQDAEAAYDLLRAASPETAAELEQRMSRRKIQDFQDVMADWPEIKTRLLDDWQIAVETGEEMPAPKRRKPPR
jgi:N12 class adenine-specific DNA methylase/predicted kinase